MALEESINARFLPDELPGYEMLKFALPEEDDGPLWATLIRKQHHTSEPNVPAVLYVHGFCDYFFQAHLCDAVQAAGFRFYALDLRRYGRSIAEGNRANQARDVSDYYLEIDWALRFILKSHPFMAGLIAHSTGGLILSHYLEQSRLQAQVRCLILNSPFLEFNLRARELFLVALVARAGRLAPYRRLPDMMSGAYGKTIHKSELGEWDYNLKLKPLFGFPLFPAWFRMIKRAHAGIKNGLSLELPILAMRSSASKFPTDSPSSDDFYCDTVLNVNHIRDLTPKLGKRVRPCVIEGGMHDLYLSRTPARDLALNETIRFLKEHAQP